MTTSSRVDNTRPQHHAAPSAAIQPTSDRRFSLTTPRQRETSNHDDGKMDRLWLVTRNTLYAGATIASGVALGPPAALAVSGLTQAAIAASDGASTGGGGGGAGQADYLTRMQEIQQEAAMTNAELFAQQHAIQEENRRYSTLSNVLRAKHDTTKSAINNIRA